MSELSEIQALISWSTNPYSGILSALNRLSIKAYDPRIFAYGGELIHSESAIGGAGLTEEEAKMACIGEAIERFQTYPLPDDGSQTCSFEQWKLNEKVIPPKNWLLFHPDQYQLPHFPFLKFTEASVCSWVCFREASSGEAYWVPEEMAYLSLPSKKHVFGPSVSTGFSCGSWGQPVLLKGVQEILERDGIMKAWWGIYEIEEWPATQIWSESLEKLRFRFERRNLKYQFYRICSPFSELITIVTVTSEEENGFCFAVGSACRETIEKSWSKSLLEAIQSLHYVRYLKEKIALPKIMPHQVIDFAHHAVYYSLRPEQLSKTIFGKKHRLQNEPFQRKTESISLLQERLGKNHPILFRNATPPAIAQEFPFIYVLRVLIPGLQPLHGNENFPLWGSPVWQEKNINPLEQSFLPHPFA